jgi:hypothetical protein
MTQKNSDSGISLISNASDYFWTNRVVAIAAVAFFPNSKEYTLLKNEGFLLCPKPLRPHPLTFCLKVSGDEQNEICKLVASNDWIFMFGDYESF